MLSIAKKETCTPVNSPGRDWLSGCLLGIELGLKDYHPRVFEVKIQEHHSINLNAAHSDPHDSNARQYLPPN